MTVAAPIALSYCSAARIAATSVRYASSFAAQPSIILQPPPVLGLSRTVILGDEASYGVKGTTCQVITQHEHQG